MSYNLSNIPKLSELLHNSDRATIAKSLNLKYVIHGNTKME